jgi:hypothetical protein
MVSKFATRKRHIATFQGVHNNAKSKVLIILYNRMFTEGFNTGLNAREIHLLSGVPYSTLSALSKWHRWGYLSRRAIDNGSRPVFVYWLGARGKHFLEDRIPPAKLRQYTEEIKAYRNEKGVVVNTTLGRKGHA